MSARLVAVLLLALLGILHAKIWLGRGNVMEVRELRAALVVQNQANAEAERRNEQLSNEVRDLREGLDMVEEIARYELGMVRPNEIFVHIQVSPALR